MATKKTVTMLAPKGVTGIATPSGEKYVVEDGNVEVLLDDVAACKYQGFVVAEKK